MKHIRKFVRKSPLAWRPYARQAFSQEGEDLVLARLFGDQADGFYVDVGAHHAWRFSNTFWAYRRGWRGINIDAHPQFDRSFRKWRRRDINVWSAVAGSEIQADRFLFVFKEPALNTMNENRARLLETRWGFPYTRVAVPAASLAEILDMHMPTTAQVIDLLSIDVEGSEMDVLRSNDWERYFPRVVVVEILDGSLEKLREHELTQFLAEKDFQPVAFLYHSAIFVSDRELRDSMKD